MKGLAALESVGKIDTTGKTVWKLIFSVWKSIFQPANRFVVVSVVAIRSGLDPSEDHLPKAEIRSGK